MRKNIHSGNVVIIALLAVLLAAIPLYFIHHTNALIAFSAVVLSIVLITSSVLWIIRKNPEALSWAVALPSRLTAYFVLTAIIYIIALLWIPFPRTVLIIAEIAVIAIMGILTVPVLGGLAEIKEVDESVRASKAFIDSTLLALSAMKGYGSESDSIVSSLYDEFRYSDPISSPSSQPLESEISAVVEELSAAVKDKKDPETLKGISKSISDKLRNRNAVVKASKRR